MLTVYDILDEWKLFDDDVSLSKLQLSDWRDVDRALSQIYESEFPGRLGSSFVGAHLTTQVADGVVGPEAIAASVLAFDAVWLFDPIYSLISESVADAWNLLPERNVDYFGKGPHISFDWRPLGHQRKYSRSEFLLRELPSRLRRLRELRRLYDTGAVRFLSWETLLLQNKERLRSSIEALRSPAATITMRHPQNEYNLGIRLSPVRVQMASDMPERGIAKGADLHFVDRAPLLLYGLMNTLISTRCGAILQPELPGDSDIYEFVMSGLNPTPVRATVTQRIELPRFSQAVWDDIVAIRKDSEVLAVLRDLIRQAAASEEAIVLADIRTRLEDAAEAIKNETALSPYFKTGSIRFGLDAVKGATSRLAGTVAAGAVAGAASGGLPGAVIGAAAGGLTGAATGFLLDLATRSFDKANQAKRNRAELFVRIAQKLAGSSEAS
jgi:hypothetical protein